MSESYIIKVGCFWCIGIFLCILRLQFFLDTRLSSLRPTKSQMELEQSGKNKNSTPTNPALSKNSRGDLEIFYKNQLRNYYKTSSFLLVWVKSVYKSGK